MQEKASPEQGELDFGSPVAQGYFENKEGFIFSLLREACPRDVITFRLVKGGSRRQFKVMKPSGEIYQLNFTEPFLYSRSPSEIRENLIYNLDYMAKAHSSLRAVFGRGCVKIRDL